MDTQANPNILKHRVDRYDAATIDVKSLPTDPNQFQTMLAETLAHFNTAKVRGVWLTIDINRSALIPIAIKQGFRYHHTKKDYVLLTTWIPKGEISKLPHYAGYFVGVGGVVINDETDEILVIQEKTSIVDDMWKVPGGLADDGEYISQAGEREVFEETGIKAKFQSLICFREKLNYKWNAADIYFVCLLKPETFEIKIDPGEIKTARWMKIDEYLKLPNMVETQKKIAEVVALRKYKGIDKIKELSNDIIVDLAGFTADEFNMTLGDRIVPNNMFYGPEIAKKLAQQKSS